MNIAIFDSGVGGLTVLKEALKTLPSENYIYYADTKNAPYGLKSREAVLGHIMDAARFLSGKDIKMLVLACNTATSVGVQALRKIYAFPVIGMEPAVKPAVELANDKRILVLATTLTLKEEKLRNLISRIDRSRLVDRLAMDELVGHAELFDFESPEIRDIIREKLAGFDISCYGFIVLGCTHFVYYRKIMKEIIPREVEIIDGNEGTVRNMRKILERSGRLNEGRGGDVEFYDSGKPEKNPERLSILRRVAGI